MSRILDAGHAIEDEVRKQDEALIQQMLKAQLYIWR